MGYAHGSGLFGQGNFAHTISLPRACWHRVPRQGLYGNSFTPETRTEPLQESLILLLTMMNLTSNIMKYDSPEPTKTLDPAFGSSGGSGPGPWHFQSLFPLGLGLWGILS